VQADQSDSKERYAVQADQFKRDAGIDTKEQSQSEASENVPKR
jgi:hypothetical protein